MANSQFAMAVHVMTMLAKHCDRPVKSSYLAESVNTNAVVIRRLLCNLHEAGLAVSQKGYSGGTCLTKTPKEISLLDIYEAVSHDNIFGLHAKEPNQNCDVGSTITTVLGSLQTEISQTVKERFDSYRLQDIIDELARCKEKEVTKLND